MKSDRLLCGVAQPVALATCESLEARRHFDVTASVINGVLTIVGDEASNSIAVTKNWAGEYVLTVGSVARQPVGGVSEITVAAKDGDDTVTIASNITIKAYINGDYGYDTLEGGGGPDEIVGGGHTDTNRGGGGSDDLWG